MSKMDLGEGGVGLGRVGWGKGGGVGWGKGVGWSLGPWGALGVPWVGGWGCY